ncbi:hypothetical protein [Mycolicibacterium sp. 050158]|uniref:hypothetical protein n=1 Tax=Mycolicibacterium sp. 050158 TaxID=3090602 RepID=UPI00299E97B6|nr:hypothetical protein [Mycolicibacterium sp. 050158]MDX1890986.1 hypothetical protein [Mycolicibacterium sp. 050158]
MPVTDPTIPEVRSRPSAAGAAAEGVVVFDDVLEAVDDVPDEPQAASEKAARPAKMAVPQRDTASDEIMGPPSLR